MIGPSAGQRLGKRQRAVTGKHADLENSFGLGHAHEHLEKCTLDLAHQEIRRGGFLFGLFEQPLVQLGERRGVPLAVLFDAFGQDFHAYRAPVFLLFHDRSKTPFMG